MKYVNAHRAELIIAQTKRSSLARCAAAQDRGVDGAHREDKNP